MKDEIWSGSALVSPRAITAPSTSTTQIDTDLTDTSRPTYWDMVALLVGLRFLRPGYWTSFATGERPPQTHHVVRHRRFRFARGAVHRSHPILRLSACAILIAVDAPMTLRVFSTGRGNRRAGERRAG